MRNAKSLSTAVLLIGLAGCATQQTQPGLPNWDYERDELKVQNQGAVQGGLLGGLFGSPKSAVAGAVVGGVPQEGIELTPSQLNAIIVGVLTPRTAATLKSAVPTAANSPDAATASWTVSESNEGNITTDWKRIPGKTSGVLWWKKEYESEVRHTVTIKQSFRSSRYANYSIVTEVRERPNESYPWAPADPELGRQSFESLKNVLMISVRAEMTKRRPKK